MKKIDDITLMIEGIPCSGCARDVETIPLGMDGIDGADFIISTNTIKILYDKGNEHSRTLLPSESGNRKKYIQKSTF